MNPNVNLFNLFHFKRLQQWLEQRQMHVLEEAYQGALEIKALEEQYFEGGKIAHTSAQSKVVYDYVCSLRERQLLRVRSNLSQFRINSFLFDWQSLPQPRTPQATLDLDSPENSQTQKALEVLEKLNFIDAVISHYRDPWEAEPALSDHAPVSQPNAVPPEPDQPTSGKDRVAKLFDPVMMQVNADAMSKPRRASGQREWKIFKEFDPAYEQRVVQGLRSQRKQKRVALRWLAILVLVPLLMHFLARHLVFEPLLGNYSERHPTHIELSREIQDTFLAELSRFKEGLEVQELLGLAPEGMNETEKSQQIEERAIELWREAREEALNGYKNILSDGVALAVFAALVYFNRSRLTAVRSLSNQAFLGLSDPVKVFLFILLTDMFVGFHSAEGWEVVLEAVARHFGLSESKTVIYLFIATVPVVVDSCIKFWIFSYLTRYSPSASAIYERMNT